MRAAAGDPAAGLRDRLVDGLLASGLVQSAAVEAAFRAVPRHLFLPGVDVGVAYADEAVPTKWTADGRPLSSSSQPAIMAVMLEQLGLAPGHRVLEIGAGTGYNAALLAHLVGASGRVVTVDLAADVVEQARDHLAAAAAAAGAAAGGAAVEVVCGDGAVGWAPGSPYDRIIVTAAAWDVAPAWRAQLAAGGRLVLPLSLRGAQRSVAFEPVGDRLDSVSVANCGFMPLRGAMAGPGGPRPLGPPGVFVDVEDDRALDTAALAAALTRPGAPVRTGVRVGVSDLWGGLSLWLGLHEPDLVRLGAIGPAVQLGLVPALIRFPGQALTTGLVGAAGLAVLVRLDPPDDRSTGAAVDQLAGEVAGTGVGEAAEFELGVCALGPGVDDLAERLADRVRGWDRDDRPGTRQLRISAHSAPVDARTLTGAIVHKRHSTFELHWSTG